MARRVLVAGVLLAVVCLVAGVAGPAGADGFAGAEWPTLMQGSRGADVKALHYLLTARQFPCSGEVFNTTTYNQVRAFQASVGLYPVDGIVGPATWARLYMIVYPGNSGDKVKAVQYQLNAKRGLLLAVNGDYNSTSQNAVLNFQFHMGLYQDAIVGGDTWRNLLWHYQRVETTTSPNQCTVPPGHSLDHIWAVGSVVGWFSEAARVFKLGWGRKVSFNDFSLEYPTHGGYMYPHLTHQRGMDADAELIHQTASRQCQDIIYDSDGD